MGIRQRCLFNRNGSTSREGDVTGHNTFTIKISLRSDN